MNQISHSNHRRLLIKELNGGLVVLSGYKAVQYMSDQAAKFIQESNFWWLTGIDNPGWLVIIDGVRGEHILIRPRVSEQQKLFDGAVDDDAIRRISGIKTIIEEKDFEATLRQLRRHHSMVYSVYDKTKYDFVSNPAGRILHDILVRNFGLVKSCALELSRLRAIKSPAEMAYIKKAVRITTEGFREVRKHLSEVKYEYEIDAILTYAFRKANAIHAYEPIVAHGKNACILHYQKNNACISKKQPVLIDAAARYKGYASDITRTYCVQPTNRQLEIHEALEQAQKDIVRLIKPGYLVTDYLDKVNEIMKGTLKRLHLIQDSSDDKRYRIYFPHAVGHGLGIDVHESLGAPYTFQPGMVLTVEPGIYIPEEGIGMRIEDTIAVTEKGNQNLSAALSTTLI